MRNLRLAAASVATAGVLAGAWATAAAAGAATTGSSAAQARPSVVAAFHGASTGTTTLKTRKIHNVTVVTNGSGRTLYWFVPDTSTRSNCNGSCAQFWPPVSSPAHRDSGVTGKVGTITRSNGAKQTTYRGHPVYTYIGDTKAGQNKGNGLNANGGVWHEMTASGSTATNSKPSSGGSGGGY